MLTEFVNNVILHKRELVVCKDCKYVGHDIFDRGGFCKRKKPWQDVDYTHTCKHAKRRKD